MNDAQVRTRSVAPLGPIEDFIDALARSRRLRRHCVVVRVADGRVLSTVTPARYVDAMRELAAAVVADEEASS